MLAIGLDRDVSRIVLESVDESGFAGLRDEWDELLGNSASDCLFLTWEWQRTWWKHLSGARRLAIVALRCDGLLVGLAPFCIRPRSLSNGHPFEVLEFLGSGHAGSDYLDVIVRKGWEPLAIEGFRAHLSKLGCMIKWNNVADDACIHQIAAQLGAAAGKPTNVCPYISLGGKTFQTYLAELGSEHRYNFHRRQRQLNRDFTVQFEAAGSATECVEMLSTVIALHNLRRSTIGGSDAFHTPGLVALHREFVPLAFERGWLKLYLLRLNGAPAASLYGFLYRGKFYYYQAGFDPAYEKYSPGMITLGLSIKAAIEDGACEFDFLHGDEPYKSRWTPVRRNLTRLELFPRGVSGQLFQASIDFARQHRKVANRVQRNSR